MDVASGHISMLGCNMDMEAISTCFEVIMMDFGCIGVGLDISETLHSNMFWGAMVLGIGYHSNMLRACDVIWTEL